MLLAHCVATRTDSVRFIGTIQGIQDWKERNKVRVINKQSAFH